MAAENHHYVPKFILRNFLTEHSKEQVSVYDKHTNRTFKTSIRNIMAENRFNEFSFDDSWIASFEPVACGAEDILLPHYRQVLAERKLNHDPMQKAALAFLIAFQFLRTRAQRDRWKDVEQMIVQKVESMGGRMQDVKGWESWKISDCNDNKRDHLLSMRDNIAEFSAIVAQKDFIIAESKKGTKFYISDNPVVLRNSRNLGPYGNIGLAVPGIEIYLPLSADLMLCAWCPSLLEGMRREHVDGKFLRRNEIVQNLRRGRITFPQIEPIRQKIQESESVMDEFFSSIDNGVPISSTVENMQFYNSLQVIWATRYVVCPNDTYEIARTVNNESPQFRDGVRFRPG